MKVQQINHQGYDVKPLISRVNSKQVKTTQISFKGYESALREIISMDFANVVEVKDAYERVFNELLNTPNVAKGRYFNVFSKYCLSSAERIVDILRKPIAKLSAEYRDIIIGTLEKAEEPILTISKNKGLFIENRGKVGFLNNVFNLQDAENDIRVVLRDGYDTEFNVSRLKRGMLKLEQRAGNYITESRYNIYSLDKRRKIDMGDSIAPVWP